jgi:hypothetical protein
MTADAQPKPKWAANLTEGQQNALQDILNQIPTTMGARDAIEGVLDKISGSESGGKEIAPKWQYLFVDEDGNVAGSNDADLAFEASESDDGTIVVNAYAGLFMTSAGDEPIEEVEDVWTEE